MRKIILCIFILGASSLQAQLPGFTSSGVSTSSSGATWTFQATVNGVVYDLQGILFKPNSTNSKYPAVIINHGTGGNVNSYSKAVAQEMVKWGLVCIATNLCHSSNAPQGSPGFTTSSYFGASPENVQRAITCWDILTSLGYVDTNCIAAFGHSRGAWTTTAMAGLYPFKFSCVAHTAGGVHNQTGSTAPTTNMGMGITAPYLMHHGDNDNTVPLSFDITLDSILNLNGITHTLIVYPGYTHSQIAQDSTMFVRTHAWFNQYMCMTPTQLNEDSSTYKINLYPNPFTDKITFDISGQQLKRCHFEIRNTLGEIIIRRDNINLLRDEIDLSSFPDGIYFLNMKTDYEIETFKLIKE